MKELIIRDFLEIFENKPLGLVSEIDGMVPYLVEGVCCIEVIKQLGVKNLMLIKEKCYDQPKSA